MNKDKAGSSTTRSNPNRKNYIDRLFGEENLEFTGTVIKKAGMTQVYFPGIKAELKSKG